MQYSELSDQELFEQKTKNNDEIFPDKRNAIIKEIEKRIREESVIETYLFQEYLEKGMIDELENHVATIYTAVISISLILSVFALIYSNFNIFYDAVITLIFLPITFLIKKTRSTLALAISIATGLFFLVVIFTLEGNLIFLIVLSFIIISGVQSLFKILKYRSMIKSWGI